MFLIFELDTFGFPLYRIPANWALPTIVLESPSNVGRRQSSRPITDGHPDEVCCFYRASPRFFVLFVVALADEISGGDVLEYLGQERQTKVMGPCFSGFFSAVQTKEERGSKSHAPTASKYRPVHLPESLQCIGC